MIDMSYSSYFAGVMHFLLSHFDVPFALTVSLFWPSNRLALPLLWCCSTQYLSGFDSPELQESHCQHFHLPFAHRPSECLHRLNSFRQFCHRKKSMVQLVGLGQFRSLSMRSYLLCIIIQTQQDIIASIKEKWILSRFSEKAFFGNKNDFITILFHLFCKA